MPGTIPELPGEAIWALDYLLTETAELGDKAARQAISEGSLDTFEDDDMTDDPVLAMAQDAWEFYYSTLAWDAVEALKPERRDGLPSRDTLLNILFKRGFLPAVRKYIDSVAED